MMGNFCRLAFDPIKLILRTLDTFFMVKKIRFLQNVSINFVNWRDSLFLAEAKMRGKGKNFVTGGIDQGRLLTTLNIFSTDPVR